MSWVTRYLSSSIGRKQIVGTTGVMLCGFLLVHLLGNFLLFAGWSEAGCAFNDYADKLTGNKIILALAEAMLISIFGSHIFFALKLNLENSDARGPVGYNVTTDAGGITFTSKHMRFTGMWILVFLILHLINFKFAEQGPKGLFGVVEEAFQSPLWASYYVLSMFILSLHLRHGVRSVFQTFGINHVKFNGIIDKVSLGYAGFIFLGFSSFPVYFFCKGVC